MPTFFTARMKTVTTRGVAEIVFSESLLPFNTSLLNSNNTNIYVEVDGQRQLEPDFDASLLNFTWKALALKSSNTVLDLEITWDNPFRVSPGNPQDNLVVHFNASRDFFKAQSGSLFDERYYTLRSSIKK